MSKLSSRDAIDIAENIANQLCRYLGNDYDIAARNGGDKYFAWIEHKEDYVLSDSIIMINSNDGMIFISTYSGYGYEEIIDRALSGIGLGYNLNKIGKMNSFVCRPGPRHMFSPEEYQALIKTGEHFNIGILKS